MVTQERTVINQEGRPLTDAAADPAQRALGIGGSDIAVILGLNPYKTPLDLYLEKRGIWRDEGESEAAHWGRVMEPVLVREYSRREQVVVLRREGGALLEIHDGYEIVPALEEAERAHRMLGTLVHPEYSWARGHLDALGLDESCEPTHVVEAKTADLRLAGHWGEAGSDEVPEHYLVQVMWYLMLCGLPMAHLAVLIGGNRFATYYIPRDEALIDLLMERGEEFWRRVEREDPPNPEPGERGRVSLARMYPRAGEREMEWTPAILRLAEELHDACCELASAEERKVTVENELKAIMADASRIILSPDGKAYVSWKNNKQTEQIDWQSVARNIAQAAATPTDAFARIVAAHTSTKPGARVFRRQGFDRLFTTART
jgi:predicted phage-related endonuclease